MRVSRTFVLGLAAVLAVSFVVGFWSERRLVDLPSKSAQPSVSSFSYTERGTAADALVSPTADLSAGLRRRNWRQFLVDPGLRGISWDDAQRLLKGMVHGPKRAAVYTALFRELYLRDREEALARVETLKGTPDYYLALRGVLEIRAKQEPNQALSQVRAVADTAQRDFLLRSMISSLSSEKPDVAWEWIRLVAPSAKSIELVGEVARAKSRQDPAAALAWAGKLPLSFERNKAVQSVVEQQAEKNPAAAAKTIDSLDNVSASLKTALEATILEKWLVSNSADALSWALARPDLSPAALQDGFKAFAESDPIGALESYNVVTSRLENIDKTALAKNVALGWMKTQPDSAASWLDQQLGEQLPGDVMRQIFYEWSTFDLGQAEKLSQSLGSVNGRDAAKTGLVMRLAADQPDKALDQVRTMENRVARLKAFYTAYDSVEKTDLIGAVKFKRKARDLGVIPQNEPPVLAPRP